VGSAVSDEPADQPLTGRARRLANLKPFVEGQSGNKSGRPKDLGRFGEILMKEFYRTVVASMGGKTVKKTQGEIVAQQMVNRRGATSTCKLISRRCDSRLGRLPGYTTERQPGGR
jgi:hypothetical protein